MKGKFGHFLLIAAVSLSAACGQVKSQSQNAANDNRTIPANSNISKVEPTVAPNGKYKLSVVFRLTENEAGKKYHEFSIRDDRTKRELPVKFYEYALRAPVGEMSEVWSPDGEYLVLNCGGFCVYKTAELAKLSKNGESLQAEKYLGKTDIVTDKGNSEYEQQFVKWDGNSSFILKAVRVKFDRMPNEKYQPEEYRYDAARRKLICLSEICGFTTGKNGKPTKIGKN